MFLQDIASFLDDRLTERDKTVVFGDFSLHFDTVQTNRDVQKLGSVRVSRRAVRSFSMFPRGVQAQ